MFNRRIAPLTALLALALVACPAYAWHGPGHEKATEAAVIALKGKLPAFFTADPSIQAHGSVDPDVFKHKRAPLLMNAEYSDHYFDLEFLGGDDLPETRYAFIDYCAAKGLTPSKVGFAPYSVTEWTERLMVAFAEHRKWPENEHIERKIVVYAGLLAHYAEDLCHPLHTTVHFDGRVAKPGAESPRTGIHLKTDALTGKIPIAPKAVAHAIEPKAHDDIFKAVIAELKKSHALVDKVYALEKRYPELPEPIEKGSAVWRFTEERLDASAEFTASLYLTAWEKSKEVELPDYHVRKGGR